ncbi:hypothetical protein TBLA_0D00900 [Henningerozyma blattae CBS 6284]|uniref:DM2 domain-containing protein n=1 Tax=Henningerozyma blattae (strain ATCC 34711 / CBS 6284 / DSM 70876 / NBRC 10599 / NRRL Y-10934 / UCD 77-7) TaxID=1071380 RepID=I2H2J6_HENB6|nr:hypothetical protein TBLA_0D00900 [Tetrapisispora blattae CBS 6284]CCH60598.1 hypothetical protein TBLA_0D00900 [Tetrapisispora blattae CBS 6284]
MILDANSKHMIDIIIKQTPRDKLTIQHVIDQVHEVFAADLATIDDNIEKHIVKRIGEITKTTIKTVSLEELEQKNRLLIEKLLKKVKKQAKAKNPSKKVSKETPKAKVANNLSTKYVVLSKELSHLLGENELPRLEITKELWKYIKNNNLQDPANKQRIISDKMLKPIFGDNFHMLDIGKVLNNHIISDTNNNHLNNSISHTEKDTGSDAKSGTLSNNSVDLATRTDIEPNSNISSSSDIVSYADIASSLDSESNLTSDIDSEASTDISAEETS